MTKRKTLNDIIKGWIEKVHEENYEKIEWIEDKYNLMPLTNKIADCKWTNKYIDAMDYDLTDSVKKVINTINDETKPFKDSIRACIAIAGLGYAALMQDDSAAKYIAAIIGAYEVGLLYMKSVLYSTGAVKTTKTISESKMSQITSEGR